MRTRNYSGGPSRARILEAIQQFRALHGYSPSMRDIAELASIGSTSVVSYHIDALIDAGIVGKDVGVTRSIRIVDTSAAKQYIERHGSKSNVSGRQFDKGTEGI